MLSKHRLVDVVHSYLLARHNSRSSESSTEPKKQSTRKRISRWLELPANNGACLGYIGLYDSASGTCVPTQQYGIRTVGSLLSLVGARSTDSEILEMESILEQSGLEKVTLFPDPGSVVVPAMPLQADALQADAEADFVSTALVVPDVSTSSDVQPASTKRTAREAFENYAERYANWTREELVRELAYRDAQLESLQSDLRKQQEKEEAQTRKLRTSQQQVRRLAAAKAKAKAAGRQGQSETATVPDSLRIKRKLEIQRTGKHESGRYLTVPSQVSLALRRNLSNVSCADLGLVIMDDASRWSVSSAEVRAGSSLIASFRNFHENMMLEMFHEDGLQAGDFNLSLHVISQDATNSDIWQKRKLCALLLHSCYLVRLEDGEGFRWDWPEMFEELRAVGDIQQVDDGSGRGAVALTSKMLSSIGCPTVQDLVLKRKSLQASHARNDAESLGCIERSSQQRAREQQEQHPTSATSINAVLTANNEDKCPRVLRIQSNSLAAIATTAAAAAAAAATK